MTTLIYAYLRASTIEQDVKRATEALKKFADERQMRIAAWYEEKVSGAVLERPELFRMIDNCQAGDIILLEQVDRLSRLNNEDWQKLRIKISNKGIRLVALDLPTSWMLTNPDPDDFQVRILSAINEMMLDMLAAMSRKDYEDRRRRQAEGIAKAKAEGKYGKRVPDMEKWEMIFSLRDKGYKNEEIAKLVGVGIATVYRAQAWRRAGDKQDQIDEQNEAG